MVRAAGTRAVLRDGTVLQLRALGTSDEEAGAVVAMFAGLPRDRTEYQRGHLCEPDEARRFVESHATGDLWSLLAWQDERVVVGMVTVHSTNHGWRRHVGEIRVVVSPAVERQGLAALLVGEAAEQARRRRLRMLQALVLDTQTGLRKAVERLGFREEAVLHNHALDHAGVTHDLLVYVNEVESLCDTMRRLLPALGVRLRPA